MKEFWSRIARQLSPYVPGEQPRIANLVKLNTNESPFGPSPLALEAMRATAVDTLRPYPDPEAQELREALAVHHEIKPEQVFVGNGSDEVLAHAFVALLKQPKPLLFPDVTYSFYPVWAQLFGLACEAVPLDDEMRVRVEDYRREAGSIVIANPNAPTGIALPRAEIARLLEDHPDIRLRLRPADRLIFVWLYRLFPSLLAAAVVFKPETLVRWHRSGFRLVLALQVAPSTSAGLRSRPTSAI